MRVWLKLDSNANVSSVSSRSRVRSSSAFNRPAPPHVNGYELQGISFPCYEIGGDYYDFIEREDGVW
jgi:serine phosphatase RsbU (regulator of sigma subunit)